MPRISSRIVGTSALVAGRNSITPVTARATRTLISAPRWSFRCGRSRRHGSAARRRFFALREAPRVSASSAKLHDLVARLLHRHRHVGPLERVVHGSAIGAAEEEAFV